MVVVDTDILIWILRGRAEIIEKYERLQIDTDGNLCITPVQIAEVYSGMLTKEKDKTDSLLKILKVVSISSEIGEMAGNLLNQYKKAYHLTLADSLTAAAAKYNNFKLWTLNKKHYPMFDDNELI